MPLYICHQLKSVFFFFSIHFIDKEKPKFSEDCPSDKDVIADEGKTDKLVDWKPITATDNDGQIPNMQVTPSEISPTDTSHTFSEGTHRVTFTARDHAGNIETCSFNVEVKGICTIFLCSVTNILEKPQHWLYYKGHWLKTNKNYIS